MNAMLSAQIAFCILVLFVAGLFISTFQRLANRPLGFSPERLLLIDASATREQPVQTWMQVADHLRQTPGVRSVSLSAWPLLSANRWTGFVRLPGRAIELRQPYFLEVSGGFFETMGIGLIDGRDFRAGDLPPRLKAPAQPLPGAGIVNETFARVFHDGANPVGRSIDVFQSKDVSAPMEIVGCVRDAAYANLREPIHPTVYLPMGPRTDNFFLVRTASDEQALAPVLRREISRVRPDLRIYTIQTQNDSVVWHLVRERLLATLSLFFAIVALALAAVGLYGVLNYSVTRQRREIGIRMALGARVPHVVKGVTANIAVMICLGSAAGIAGSLLGARFLEAFLFEVRATDIGMVIMPVIALTGVALLAALPPAMRAARTLGDCLIRQSSSAPLLRIYQRLFPVPVLLQPAGAQCLKSVLLKYGRGTRGSGSPVSKRDDEFVFGNFVQARFELSGRNIDVTPDAAELLDLFGLANIQVEDVVLAGKEFFEFPGR